MRIATSISTVAGQITKGTYKLSPQRAKELHESDFPLTKIPLNRTPFWTYLNRHHLLEVGSSALDPYPDGRLGYELD